MQLICLLKRRYFLAIVLNYKGNFKRKFLSRLVEILELVSWGTGKFFSSFAQTAQACFARFLIQSRNICIFCI